MNLVIREYQEDDLESCKQLWRELTQHHRNIYSDQSIGGEDPGIHFEHYLKKTNLCKLWIAEEDSVVIGMAGLLLDEDEGEIEPVVIRPDYRSQGIGTLLIESLKNESKARGVRYLSINPVARNVEAIQCFYRAGFKLLGHIEMFLDLTDESDQDWQKGVTIHGHPFRD
ncbi:MAG TPA: GNAT family N-acetyltransferase [Anaerolineales bacterium]|nr:GNAT family N-acetyltransferase [Anaerolineales bacterium]